VFCLFGRPEAGFLHFTFGILTVALLLSGSTNLFILPPENAERITRKIFSYFSPRPNVSLKNFQFNRTFMDLPNETKSLFFLEANEMGRRKSARKAASFCSIEKNQLAEIN
jgi:hypothetical protein